MLRSLAWLVATLAARPLREAGAASCGSGLGLNPEQLPRGEPASRASGSCCHQWAGNTGAMSPTLCCVFPSVSRVPRQAATERCHHSPHLCS